MFGMIKFQVLISQEFMIYFHNFKMFVMRNFLKKTCERNLFVKPWRQLTYPHFCFQLKSLDISLPEDALLHLRALFRTAMSRGVGDKLEWLRFISDSSVPIEQLNMDTVDDFLEWIRRSVTASWNFMVLLVFLRCKKLEHLVLENDPEILLNMVTNKKFPWDTLVSLDLDCGYKYSGGSLFPGL